MDQSSVKSAWPFNAEDTEGRTQREEHRGRPRRDQRSKTRSGENHDLHDGEGESESGPG